MLRGYSQSHHTSKIALKKDQFLPAKSALKKVKSLQIPAKYALKKSNCIPNRIIGLYNRIGVTNCSAIRCVQIGDILGASLDFTDTAQLVFCLLVGDPGN